MKIVVTLSEPDLVVTPGSAAQLVVTMTNHQDTPDRLSLEIEGLDVEWYAIPVPAVNVAPGAQASERILVKVARSNENRAGSYPFLVRVQAMETGEVGMAQGTLVIQPYSSLQVELTPKRAVATYFSRFNDFDVTVANFGNAEETLELYATDPDDGCAYEYDVDRINLKPGHSQIVPLAIRPKTSSLLGGTRLYGFTVSARSVADSYISANAHGQIEKRALISPLLGIFLALLGIVGFGIWKFRPTPPPPLVINSFAASEKRVNAGMEVALTWEVSPSDSQIVIWRRVKQDGVDVADPGPQRSAVSSIRVRPEAPLTVYTLVVKGPNGSKKEKTVTVEVTPPPPAPKPTLKFFRADPPIIHQGESVMLSWEATGARELILDPGNITLSRFEQTRQITPTRDITYSLRAIGVDDKLPPASKTVEIKVVSPDTCIAEVVRFATQPAEVFAGDKFKLKWQTRYARSVRIESTALSIGEVATSGSKELQLTDPTTFTLTATDSAGKTTSKTFTVTPKSKPAPPITPSGEPTTVTPNGTNGAPP